MISARQDAFRIGPTEELSIACAIVTIAVATAVMIVTEPALFILLYCLPLVLAAIWSFDFFVYGMVFLLPWYPFLDLKLPVRDISLLSRFVLFAGVWLIQRKNGRSIKNWLFAGRFKKGVLIFAGIAIISVLASPLRANLDAYRSLARLCSYLAVFFAITGWIESREQVINTIRILLVSTTAVALFGFYQVWERGYTDLYFRMYPMQEEALEPWVGRITSLLFHYNSLAGYLNLAIPFSIGCMFLAKDVWTRYLGVICFGTASAALYLTESRGGLVAYGALLLVCIWYLTPKFSARLGILLLIASLVAIAVPYLSEHSERLLNLDEQTQLSRIALWGAAGLTFIQHPILGIGYGNYRMYNADVTGGVLDAHDLYLQFLAEIGIVGFLAFIALVGAFFWMGIKLVRKPDALSRIAGIGVCGAIASTLVHGFVDYLFNTSPQFGGLFWLVLALGFVMFENSKHEVGNVFWGRA